MKDIEMTKNTEKINYNLKIFVSFVDQFDKFHENTVGMKGEKASAGLMAIMALHLLDEPLANALADPDITVKKAASLIETRMRIYFEQQAFEQLTPEQRSQLLRDAKQSREKVIGKK